MAVSTIPSRFKSRTAAQGRVPEWEPSRNSIHRLIQLMDVMAIAFNKYRQLSFDIPRHGTPEYSPDIRNEWLDRLSAGYLAVHKCVFPHDDFAPQYTAQRLANDAVADAAHMGIVGAEAAICAACDWLQKLGWVLTPKTAECYGDDWRTRFEAQGELLFLYSACRQNLLTILAQAGHRIPIDVQRRFSSAFQHRISSDDPSKGVDHLLALVRDADEVSCSADTHVLLTDEPANYTMLQFESLLIAVAELNEAAERLPTVMQGSEADIRAENLRRDNLGERITALKRRVESTSGYEELRKVAMVRFRDDLSGAVCKAMRCALVESGLKPSEADVLTLVEVVDRLRPGVSAPQQVPSGERKRCSSSVELAALQFKRGMASLMEEHPGKTAFTDKEVYGNCKENDCDLPAAKTWFRYLRSARKAELLTAKNRPRTPYTGRSAVPASHRG